MAITVSTSVTPLIGRARRALAVSQKELAELFGISLRTAHRWDIGGSIPTVDQVRQLAAMVFPHDPELATELARETETTLEGLGLVEPAPPVAPAPVFVPAPVGPPPRMFPPIELMIDSVFLAAIDAAAAHGGPSTTPREAVPAILKAAFARARGLGLSTEEIDDVLTSRAGTARA